MPKDKKFDDIMLTDVPNFPNEYHNYFSEKKHYDFLKERYSRCIVIPM